MSRGKKTSALFFNTIAALFSAVLLVLSLLCAVETAAVNDRAAALKKENERLKTENQILQARLDNSLSIAELERRSDAEAAELRLKSASRIDAAADYIVGRIVG